MIAAFDVLHLQACAFHLTIYNLCRWQFTISAQLKTHMPQNFAASGAVTRSRNMRLPRT